MNDESAARPWLALYGGRTVELFPRRDNVLDLFRDAAEATPDKAATFYFDTSLSYRELDQYSDALAVWLLENQVLPGDRVAIVLQNDPQFLIAILAAWKVNALPVPMNPMYRSAELTRLFEDCAPRVIFCYVHDCDAVGEAVNAARIDSTLMLCSPRTFQSRDDERVLPPLCPFPAGYSRFSDALDTRSGGRVPRISPAGSSAGLLLYTSGTTGKPKGALSSHAAMAFNGTAMAEWCKLTENSRVLAIAPFFHITGLVCHIALTFACGASMVVNYRFEAGSVLEAIRVTRPTYTIGAITAFIALMNAPGANAEDFKSFDSIYSGGAPIAPSVRDEFLKRMGKLVFPSYGMTETAAPTHLCPIELDAPVDGVSGALAVGIPLFNVDAKIVDESGARVAPGIAGELWLKGPQITMGYWNKPEETAEALTNGWLHSGDIAVMDENGWFYLVDRKKDVIIASGFKVWPREVEDVLYAHPAVREAAVIGVPDPYRGQTVKAYISLKATNAVAADEIVRYCQAKLASYKVPKIVEIVDELPKTATGKIQRNVLRDRSS